MQLRGCMCLQRGDEGVSLHVTIIYCMNIHNITQSTMQPTIVPLAGTSWERCCCFAHLERKGGAIPVEETEQDGHVYCFETLTEGLMLDGS